MLRMVSLDIRRWRDTEPCTLRFNAGPVFVMGLNGAGKTTLLELIGRLLRGDVYGLLEEEPGEVELSVELVVEGEAWQARPNRLWDVRLDLTARAGSMPSPDRYLHHDQDPTVGTAREWRCRITMANGAATAWSGGDPEPKDQASTRPVQVEWGSDPTARVDEADLPFTVPPRYSAGLVVGMANVQVMSDFKGHRLNPDYPLGLLVGNVWYRETQDGPTRFDEAHELYRRIIPPESLSLRELSAGLVVHGGHPLKRKLTPPWAPTQLPGHPRPSTPDPVPALLAELIGAARVDIEAVEHAGDHLAQTYLGYRVHVEWPDGSWTTHHQLSFGQKRLLAWLWYEGLCPEAPVLTDELTNGMHARWVEVILERLQGRQGFHAVQNPLLIDLWGLAEEPEIPGQFVICGVEVGPEGRRWTWRNPTPEEAARLRRAYDSGYQQLSQILRSEGLW